MLLGQTYTENFYRGDLAPIWENMTRQMRAALGTEDGLRHFRGQVSSDVGTETDVLSEIVENLPDYRTYKRRASFSKFSRPIVVSWSFDANDRIAGFFIRPEQDPARSPYLDYDTKAHLRLPFEGEWFVFWGGRTVDQNYHAAVRNQRFAYDLLVVKNGSSHHGDGTKNDQYFCWGQPILAPASGRVVKVVSGLIDNPPGVMDKKNPPGNHVMLDLGNQEYALLAHMQKGSISVTRGEEIRSGQQVGRCGNSGNTTEPHLHFHLQDHKTFGKGDGKPAFFNNYRSNGRLVDRGEPVKGETISPDTGDQ